ncbi:di-heme oxidoreductase family protein [Mangrovimonas xylaniphaga]|uniref:di-heme oxidoreductase family protein n=1 Tax=Mangrovimonas xylaniphaga TaxID=1645915 RepID=UPI0006B4699F|nr:di-heme oxidoredictase family protein [Mangrovimonas xylaniphaga]
MRKANRLLVGTLLMGMVVSCQKDDQEGYESVNPLTERTTAGGETTVYLTSSNSFSTPAANLSASQIADHFDADLEFGAVFVSAPAEVNGGVGPVFNNTSCISCHPKDGRSAFPSNINSLSGFFLRASLPGTDALGGPVAVPGFGKQLQNQAIYGYEPEVQFSVEFTNQVETLADGTEVILKKPSYNVVDTYIPFPSEANLSPRLAPPVFGLGLLEVIPEYYILQYEDVNDADGDGISGKANYVYNHVTESMTLGRFGWKANTASIIEQCAGAYLEDMGITTPLFPQETGHDQSNGNDGFGDDPEVSYDVLEQVAFYCKTLGVPAARNLDQEHIQNGARIFEELQCASCHVPKMISEEADINVLANQEFYPYTDMLLHDMGPGLADNRSDFLADGQEWKTRPLWGIGLTQVVNGHTHFLHDGRAKNVTEAILWHGGEAEAAKNGFKNLSASERQDLLDFVNSL